jgi:hypothetical protein
VRTNDAGTHPQESTIHRHACARMTPARTRTNPPACVRTNLPGWVRTNDAGRTRTNPPSTGMGAHE